MTDSFFSPPSLRVLVRCSVLGAVLSTAMAFSAAAQTCPKGCGFNACGTPGLAVASSLWGELESAEPTGQLPRNRDSTHFVEFGPNSTTENSLPWFSSVDVEQGAVFTSTSYGVTTWKRENDGSLSMVGRLNGANDFPFMAGGELSLPLQDVDAPPGDDDVVAVSGVGGFGIAIIDNRNPTEPKVAYQHDEHDGNEVYAGNIGGNPYAFLAANAGLLVYDMEAALGHNRCRRSSGLCNNVYKGTFGRASAKYVDGDGDFVVVSFGSGRGIEIWDFKNPTQPRLALSALGGTGGIPVDGVALWSQGNKHYLALATSYFVGGIGNVYEGRTYDVSCITGTCGSIGSPLDTIPLAVPSGRSFVTFSRAGGRPFVFFGNDNRCSSGKREFVVDVSNPSVIFDVSPTGYWESISHMNRVWSGRAKFDGEILYRAGNAVFDSHRLAGGAPPTASFTVPAPVYRDVPVVFTDTSTGLVESRSWTFSGGSPATSGAPAPSVTFASTGTKSVSLVVGNGAGSDTEIANVTVLDPTPNVSGVTQSPTAPVVCQPVTLTATATGPGLSYAWTVKDALGATVPAAPGQTFNSNPFVWNTAALTQPDGGTYTATVVASSQHGNATAERPVVLGALPGLPVTGFPITNDAFSFGSVKFHAAVPGATEWSWDFDGFGVFGPWITDPIAGPHPTHDYTTTGLKNVKVRVRNCQFPNGVESAVLPVTIVTIDPLVAGFKATDLSCFGALGCSAETGQAITFVDESSGTPDSWAYAWTNTSATGPCSGFGPSQATPSLSHTYTAAGGFRPCVKVTRGNEFDEFRFPQFIDVFKPVVNPPTPGVTVGGPTSGSSGVGYGFSASATNCTPAANGWTWTTSGGTIDGSSTGASINVSWSTTGSKSVTARNSACGTALGSRSISIGGGGGGGTLTPQFSFNPPSPVAGQNVSFNASATTGSSQFYDWSFGDGGSGSGQVTSHAFTTAGTYQVTLTVAPPDCASPGCFKSLTKAVTVAPAGDGGGGGGGGGSLAAAFAFAPAAPAAGEAVGFDAGASTGSPADFAWDFGDGATGSGKVVSHTYDATGSYTVTLTVSTAGCVSPGCFRSTSKVVVVAASKASANGCAGDLADDPDKLCLGEGRYIVEVDWENQHQPQRPVGEGQFRRLSGSESTGFFWFFNPDSIDLIIKIIDGSVVNEHVWVFYGALTDVIYELDVTDTLTGKTKTYKNAAGSICGRGDTAAFSTAGLTVPPSAGAASTAAGEATNVTGEATTELLLLDGRFKATVNWENQHAPTLQTGAGSSVAGTNGSGYFWFFEQSSLDLVVKMIDARQFDGNFWVFYGGMSDVKYTLEIEDLVTGETWERVNPPGSICGGSDTAAFTALGN